MSLGVSLEAGVAEGGPLGAALGGIEWEFPVGVVEGETEGTNEVAREREGARQGNSKADGRETAREGAEECKAVDATVTATLANETIGDGVTGVQNCMCLLVKCVRLGGGRARRG